MEPACCLHQSSGLSTLIFKDFTHSSCSTSWLTPTVQYCAIPCNASLELPCQLPSLAASDTPRRHISCLEHPPFLLSISVFNQTKRARAAHGCQDEHPAPISTDTTLKCRGKGGSPGSLWNNHDRKHGKKTKTCLVFSLGAQYTLSLQPIDELGVSSLRAEGWVSGHVRDTIHVAQ